MDNSEVIRRLARGETCYRDDRGRLVWGNGRQSGEWDQMQMVADIVDGVWEHVVERGGAIGLREALEMAVEAAADRFSAVEG